MFSVSRVSRIPVSRPRSLYTYVHNTPQLSPDECKKSALKKAEEHALYVQEMITNSNIEPALWAFFGPEDIRKSIDTAEAEKDEWFSKHVSEMEHKFVYS